MTAPDNIKNLVKRFEEHREAYRADRYNETQLRREFLDPFFEALGWDIFNEQGFAEPYKDVIHEDSLEIEGENKAPPAAIFFTIAGVLGIYVVNGISGIILYLNSRSSPPELGDGNNTDFSIRR